MEVLMRVGVVAVLAMLVGCGEPSAASLFCTGCGPVEAPAMGGAGQGGTSATSTSASASSGPGEGAGGQGSTTTSSGGEGGAGGTGGGPGEGGQGGEGGGPLDPGPTILVSNLSAPWLLQCDGARLYWVEIVSGDVRSASLDGSDVTTLAAGAAPNAIDADIDGTDLVYVVPGQDGRIVRVPMSGGSPSTVATLPFPRDVKSYNGALYWSDEHTVYTAAGTFALVSDYSIESVEFDATGFYFTETRNGCYFMPYGGGAPRLLARVGTTSPHSLRLDGDYAIWGTSAGPVRAPKGIGFPETIAPASADTIALAPGLLAWTGANVYTKHGADPHRVIAPLHGVGSVVLRGGYMYWTSISDGIIGRAVP